MIKTIRIKLFIIFLVFMVTILVGGVTINMIFLEKYYIYKNKHIFIQTFKDIEQAYKLDKRSINNYITNIYKDEGIACYIINKDLKVVHYSVSQKVIDESTRINREIQTLILENINELDINFIYKKLTKDKSQIPKIIFVQKIKNDEILILTKPMKGIVESAQIANEFYLIVGSILIVIGSVGIFIFSKKITKPIVDMSVIADNIANLNFSDKINIMSEDEIGILGGSINNISQKLSSSMNSLKEDIEVRKELVRNISHELKTPIGVIKGYTEGLKYGIADEKEKMDKYCDIIVDECDRMDKLVKEMLELSKLEDVLYSVNLKCFLLNELIEELKLRFTPVFEQNDINYSFICEKNLMVEADYSLLERALTNYITNAIKYVNNKGIIEVNAVMGDKKFMVSVYNSGKQLPEEEILKIWDVFYKVEKSRSRNESGHGLGLSIVKQIATLHKGKAWAENYKEGITFIIEI